MDPVRFTVFDESEFLGAAPAFDLGFPLEGLGSGGTGFLISQTGGQPTADGSAAFLRVVCLEATLKIGRDACVQRFVTTL